MAFSGYKLVGDLNGDLISDFVIRRCGNSPRTQGLPGSTVLRPLGRFGCDVASAFKNVVPIGDVNGDGAVDLLTGATGRCKEIAFTAPGGGVRGVRGQRSVLEAMERQRNCDYFGLRVISPGDLDGDGIADAVIDVPGYGVGGIRVFSTASGNQLASYPAPAMQHYPHGLVALGDVDGDGFREFAVQGPDVSHVEVISVATSTMLCTLNAPPTASVSLRPRRVSRELRGT